MKSAYRKDILRTLKNGKKRFFSILLITALGVTMLTGLKASCVDLRRSADRLYDQQNLFDIHIASTLGLDDDDVEALRALSDVREVEGEYSESVYTEIDGARQEAEVRTLGEHINIPTVVEGRLPKAADEVAVNQTYLLESGKSIGDTLTFESETEDSVFRETKYTITAEVINPMDVNNRDGNVSFRAATSVDYTFFIPWEAADTDVYTAVYLTIDGAKDLLCYSDSYTDEVNRIKKQIESEIKSQREQARYDAVKADAMEEYQDAESDVRKELDEAQQKLADARAELEAGKEELAEGKVQIADGKDQIAEGKAQIADGKAQISDGKEQIRAGKETLAQQSDTADREFKKAREEIEEGYAALESAKTTFERSEQELERAKEQIEAGKAALSQQEQDALAAIENGLDQLEESVSEARAAQAALEAQAELLRDTPGEELNALLAQIEEMKLTITELTIQQEGLQQQKSEVLSQFADARSQLSQQEAEWQKGFDALKEGRTQWERSKAELDAGKAELESEEREAGEQIAAGRRKLQENEWELQKNEQELRENERKLLQSERKLQESEQELADGEQELVDGEAKLLENEQEFADSRQEAMDELADAKQEIEDIDMTKWYVQSRDSLSGYANVENDAVSIEGLAAFFPVIFFVVAILISLTTITRMVEEDRGLIGTYKALGFTNREIRRKYVVYAAGACVAGGIAGDFCGFIILPKIIFTFFETMYMIPTYVLSFDALYGSMGIVLFTAGVLIAVLIACRAELSHMPAILMRPQVPKKGSRIFLEYIPGLWKRFSFLNKVTARNLFRYKKRLIMTVVGIMGCTGLLVCGFAIKDTVTELMPRQYEDVNRYDIMAVALAEDNEQLLSYMDDEENIDTYINIQIDSIKIKNAEGKEQSVQMFVVPKGTALDEFIHIMDHKGTDVDLSETGILVTRNAADVLSLDEGEIVSIQDLSLNETEMPVDTIVENYLGNMVYVSQEYYEKNVGEYAPNAVLIKLKDSCGDPVAYAKALGEKESLISTTCTETLKAEFSKAFSLMNMVVYVIIILAAGLAFVVLFTLSTTNISERCRELATIKVLGFYDREVHLYVNKETLILTVIGIIFGLPAGYAMGRCLTWALKIPGIYFAVSVYPISYIYSAVSAFVFALVVNLITNRILNAIDPVEALKSVE